ncbi:HNH endonuclease [Streptomyces rimosus]|uniref:HNH endonuclease n=1 Tax=Streptomyces rimosus TaxID=1927 RepID=UPI00067C7145|nr:HNH endonuclease signature motif containing protein [Streptomyces rimosus]
MDAARKPPDWRDTKVGTKVRAAAWLATVVGEGNMFSRKQLHEAFPDVANIDRRLRDLRGDYGWDIKVFRGAPEGADMQLVKIGDPVWDPARTRRSRPLVSAAERMWILERDGFRCTSCGISAGESHLDSGDPAQLYVRHVVPISEGGKAGVENMVTLCNSCNAGVRALGDSAARLAKVSRYVCDLPARQQTILLAWMAKGERSPSPVERAWAMYRHLSPELQKIVRQKLADEVERTADAETEV